MQTNRQMMWNSVFTAVVAAFLGFMAFGTGWHAGLFGFLAFSGYTVGNRISQELAATRAALRRSPDPL